MKTLEQLNHLMQSVFSTLPAVDLPSPGLYHFIRSIDGYDHHLHIRVENDGSAVFFIDANRIIYLNSTAACITYWHMLGKSRQEILLSLNSIYGKQADLAQDYEQTISRIEGLLHPGDTCPVCDLELELALPFSTEPLAPYRMDLALTYRCNNDCAHCYNARSRTFSELTIADWKQILNHIWDIGIPHVVFTGGEPTLRDDLPELIAYAQNMGLITGLNTNGRRLMDVNYVNQLVTAGLDHVQITFESHIPEIHDDMVRHPGAWQQTVQGIQNAVASPLYVMTNTTMLQHNANHLRETLQYLGKLGVPTVGINALIYSGAGLTVNAGIPENQLPSLLEIAREITEQQGQRLIWYTPTQYCHFNPIHFELGIKGCSAARYNMCIEPNGDVLPCQSYYQSLGNFLHDTWPTIWQHPLALQLRRHQNLPQACTACDFLAECGGGCPLARQAGKVTDPVSIRSF
jgi:radical SAM protein with 4Fe4S-binding SPASM domain